MQCFSLGMGNEFRFVDNTDRDAADNGISFLSWRLNVTGRASLFHRHNGGRRFKVEAVQHHNDLLPSGILGAVKKLNDTRKHDGDGLLVDELANSVKSGTNNEVVIGGEVFLDCVDDKDGEVVVIAEEKREGEVAGALQEEGVVAVSFMFGVVVAERKVILRDSGIGNEAKVRREFSSLRARNMECNATSGLRLQIWTTMHPNRSINFRRDSSSACRRLATATMSYGVTG
ncbi:hypothetical protein JHK86_051038 [Glycine max]|nr:hypothetical protein JHK86_051038 [Glycine max]